MACTRAPKPIPTATGTAADPDCDEHGGFHVLDAHVLQDAKTLEYFDGLDVMVMRFQSVREGSMGEHRCCYLTADDKATQKAVILFRNAAMFPVTGLDRLFPEDSSVHACAVACDFFSTSWQTIALAPSAELKGEDSPEPIPCATAVTSMPVIRIPAVKYSALIRGLRELERGSGEGEALSLDASKDVIHGLGMDRNKNMLSG
ncbi:unnamed protein product [Durusdinium trenchii]|uniref:Uncharacterized protein n=1 Tax=Durusdinium trenchii TaxID=1381693 RepID=A0ABP0LH11_9DINO